MSGGPIKAERDAWKPRQSTRATVHTVHMRGEGDRTYCGRRAIITTPSWESTECEDCHAARRADLNQQKEG